MNIALFTDTYPPEINGVATSTENLKKTLVAHGHNVIVVATNPHSNEVTFEDGVVRVPGISLKKLYGYRVTKVYSKKAMDIILKFRPDVVHCQTDAGNGLLGMIVARKLKIGMVYTFHTMFEDYAYYVTKGHFDRFARHSVRWFFRNKSNQFTEVIAPSKKIQDYLITIGITKNVPIIPTGIEFSRFAPEKENKERTAELQKKFGIDPKEKVILSLGRVAKEKSIDVLLRGYARFLEKGEPFPTRFVVVGWGPAEQELKELASQLGIQKKVVFTGPCSPDETQDYYRLGHYFASASVTETQGLTFMEAMAAHLIVMARYDDNLVGTIKDGQTGFFFFDEEDFDTKLRQVLTLSEEKKQVVRENALQAIDVYSMERFYQNVIEVYERVRKKNW